jgi:hypothetical protein
VHATVAAASVIAKVLRDQRWGGSATATPTGWRDHRRLRQRRHPALRAYATRYGAPRPEPAGRGRARMSMTSSATSVRRAPASLL